MWAVVWAQPGARSTRRDRRRRDMNVRQAGTAPALLAPCAPKWVRVCVMLWEDDRNHGSRSCVCFAPICAFDKTLYVQVYISMTVFCHLLWKTNSHGFLWEVGQWWREIWLFVCALSGSVWFELVFLNHEHGGATRPCWLRGSLLCPARPWLHAAPRSPRGHHARGITPKAATWSHLYGFSPPSSLPDQPVSFPRTGPGLVSCLAVPGV